MLKNLGLYLIKHRYNAALIAFVCALLPFVGLLTSWISLIILGFITLRKGLREGALILVWIALPAMVIGLLGNPALLVGVVLLRGVIIWLLADLLRRTASWALVMQGAAFIGIVGICILHGLVPDVSAWWLQQLSLYLQGISHAFNMQDSMQTQNLLLFISRFASGILAVTLLGFDLLLLILARAWQSSLFNPKGLGKELCQLRHGYSVSILTLICVLAALLGSALALDLLPVLLMLYAASGLSLIHSKLAIKTEIKLPLLVALYFSLVLFLPYMALLLSVLGFADSWFNFRVRSLMTNSR